MHSANLKNLSKMLNEYSTQHFLMLVIQYFIRAPPIGKYPNQIICQQVAMYGT